MRCGSRWTVDRGRLGRRCRRGARTSQPVGHPSECVRCNRLWSECWAVLGEDVKRRRTVEVQVPGVHRFSTRCWSRAMGGVVRPTRPSDTGAGLGSFWGLGETHLGFLSSSPFPWLRAPSSPSLVLPSPFVRPNPYVSSSVSDLTRSSLSLHSLADPFNHTGQVWLTPSRRLLCPRPHPSPPPCPPSPLKTHTLQRPSTSKQSLPQTSFASDPSALGTKES